MLSRFESIEPSVGFPPKDAISRTGIISRIVKGRGPMRVGRGVLRGHCAFLDAGDRVSRCLVEEKAVPGSVTSAPEVSQTVPAHVEDTVQAVARFHAKHEADATALQRVIERLTRRAGRPGFIALLTVFVIGWIGLNLGLIAAGRPPLDEPPFFWLQGAVTLTALYMTVLILTTQRREDKLAGLRDQLTLELSILSEQKSAKIIGLLEELRRDDPNISDRPDEHADALSKPADPNAVLDALKDTQEPVA